MSSKFDYLRDQTIRELEHDYERVVDLAQAILSEIDVRKERRKKRCIHIDEDGHKITGDEIWQ